MPTVAEHPGSRDTFDTLSSGRDGLERFRILEDVGQYVLNGVQGDVVEIGVGESSFFLTRLTDRFKRRMWHCDVSPGKIVNPMTIPGYLGEPRTYLEERDSVPETLARVICFAGTSDALFRRFSIGPVALAFIDGDHTYDQAKKDFDHLWPLVVPNGVVALHDTYPPDAAWTDENHCGEVYRLRQTLEARADLDCFTFSRGTAIGVGITFVRKRDPDYAYR